MVKDNISRDANRIALMDELTYRHLYGQIYCKIPGDVNNRMEIYVRDSRGILIATIHPDDNGKFYLSNLHPDQNYIFSFKKDVPDCKINVMDNNGAVLFVFAKDKMEKYVFDKDAYETVHTAINDAHFLGDTLKSTYAPNDHVNIATVQPEVKNVASIPSVVTEENIPTGTVINKVKPSEDHQPPVTGAPDKIIVETLPGNVNAGELIEAKRKDTLVKQEEATGNIQPSIPPRKSHIIVTTLADTVGLYVPPANEKSEKQEGATVKNELAATSKKSKIIVTSQPDMGNTDEKPRRAELDGATLMDMSLQMSKLYQGTVVCVVNDSADYSDIASVNPKGEFLLQGFLSYKLTTPYPKSGIISQTVFINDKMQIIETINKRISNGRYVYSQNSQEKTSRRAIVKIIPDKNNYELASTIYFDRSQAVLPPEGRIQLDKLVESISENQKIRIYLVAHADVNGSISPNKKLAADRSTATIEYLVSKGIKRTRITGKGYSSTKPIYQLLEPAAISEESRKRRRVDIFIKEN